MSKIQFSLSVISGILLIVSSSCYPSGRNSRLFETASDANHNMMSLNSDSVTLGERRIKALSETYPDIDPFIERQGKPKFIAESKSQDEHFIVFYYPESQKAYACRNVIGSTTRMEFSGPYPIQADELETLKAIESGGSQKF